MIEKFIIVLEKVVLRVDDTGRDRKIQKSSRLKLE
jgi:hypothetical protein